MEQSVDMRRNWADDTKPEAIVEIIESLQTFYFQYNGHDYLIEGFGSRRDDSLRIHHRRPNSVL
jgi:hypothetical protein